MLLLSAATTVTVIVLIALAGLYVVGIPLLVLKSISIFTHTHVTPLDPATDVQPESREYFDSLFHQMQKLGFSMEGCYSVDTGVGNTLLDCVMFSNRQTKETALSSGLYTKRGDEWKHQASFTEIQTNLSDESSIATNDFDGLSGFLDNPANVQVALPHFTEIHQLHKAHQNIVRHFIGRRTRNFPLDTHFNGDALACLSEDLAKGMRWPHEKGYLKLAAGAISPSTLRPTNSSLSGYQLPWEEVRDEQRYVLTIKGAYLMTWPELWPFKPILKWRKFAKGRKVLAEVTMNQE